MNTVNEATDPIVAVDVHAVQRQVAGHCLPTAPPRRAATRGRPTGEVSRCPYPMRRIDSCRVDVLISHKGEGPDGCLWPGSAAAARVVSCEDTYTPKAPPRGPGMGRRGHRPSGAWTSALEPSSQRLLACVRGSPCCERRGGVPSRILTSSLRFYASGAFGAFGAFLSLQL